MQYQQYYPFGWEQPGRSFTNGTENRFNFNGQEKSPEISDGHQTALFWEYDARSVHRWNVDPVPIPSLSSYHIMEGNPIIYSDPLGNTVSPKFTGDALKTYNSLIQRMNNNDIINLNYKYIDERFGLTKLAKEKGASYGALFVNVEFGEDARSEGLTYISAGPEVKGNSKRSKFTVVQMGIQVEIGRESLNYAVVSEELFHAGQYAYYRENHDIKSQTTFEVEAKIATVYSYYQNNKEKFSGLSAKDVEKSFIANGFEIQELYLLFEYDGDNINYRKEVKDAFDYQDFKGKEFRSFLENDFAKFTADEHGFSGTERNFYGTVYFDELVKKSKTK